LRRRGLDRGNRERRIPVDAREEKPMKTYVEERMMKVEVDPRIAELVEFAKFVGKDPTAMSDATLIALAREFWEREHGED
jgi:hypothetical protein